MAENIISSQKAYKTLKSQTLVSQERFSTIENFFKHAKKEDLKGDVVECGTWKGGTFAYMCHICLTADLGTCWGLDSFEGLPDPSDEDGQKAKVRMKRPNKLEASISDVNKSLSLIGIDPENELIKIVKGFFESSVPETKKKIKKISLLRLDGDWYDSTKICLENFYDLVVDGGMIVIDDYGHWEGCKKAVDEFRQKKEITTKLQKTDYTEYTWIKE